MSTKLMFGDCLELMRSIPDESIDMILCDPPYGTTANKWDKMMDFAEMWNQYKRIIKSDGVIAIFATQPFTSMLICSNLEMYRYNWIWKKPSANGFLNANYAPLKQTEDICVFSKATVGSLSKNPIRYYPQGVTAVNKEKRNNPNSKYRTQNGYGGGMNVLNSNTKYIQKYSGYPNNIIECKRDRDGFHPTQKPVALLEYLIKTYTNEGETVLDNCMGSGSTGVACMRLGRSFIGIDNDEKYFNIAKERIERENE